MNKLNYANAAALIADFNAGAKFEVHRGGAPYRCEITGFAVETQGEVRALHKTGGIAVLPIDGSRSRRYSDDWRLVKTADAPKAAEPSLIYPLPFKTFDELVEAFEAGTEFVVERPTGALRDVLRVERVDYGVRVVDQQTPESGWVAFKPSGINSVNRALLKVRGEIKRKPATAEAPLLKRFVLGEDFHCPKTGENLFAVMFRKGVLEVYLRGENGSTRMSTNYKHDGVHKFHADRSLVPGVYVKPVPPAPKKIKATIYKHAYNGTLFVIRDGEVLPSIRGISNAKVVGETEIDA